MSTDQYLFFVLVTSTFMLSPGPSVILAITNGVRFGTGHAMTGALGNVAAFQVLTLLSALGLGAVLTASGGLFYILKIAGAAYLVYLGVKLWLSPTTNYDYRIDITAQIRSRLSLFKQAFLVTSSNPKALIYVTALLPQFINPEEPLLIQVMILGLTSAVLQILIFLFYVVLAGRAKQLMQSEKSQSIFSKFSGMTFIGFGAALGMSENKI